MGNGNWSTVVYDEQPILVAFDEGPGIEQPWTTIYLMGTLVLDGKETDVAATLSAGGKVIDSLSINDPEPALGATEAAWSEAVSIVQWIASEHYAMFSVAQAV